MALLVGERLGEERLDRLDRGAAEPADQLAHAAVLAEQPAIELERRQMVGLRQQPGEALVRRGEAAHRRAPPRRGADGGSRHRDHGRASAAAPRSSPNSGLLSTAASVRSSSGSSSASPSAIRSITAISSASTRRSAPATGTCSCLSWRTSSSCRMPRRGSRIITSSGRIARSPDGSGVPSRSQSRIRVPIAARERPLDALGGLRAIGQLPGLGGRGRLDGGERPELDHARARCAVRSRGAAARRRSPRRRAPRRSRRSHRPRAAPSAPSGTSAGAAPRATAGRPRGRARRSARACAGRSRDRRPARS